MIPKTSIFIKFLSYTKGKITVIKNKIKNIFKKNIPSPVYKEQKLIFIEAINKSSEKQRIRIFSFDLHPWFDLKINGSSNNLRDYIFQFKNMENIIVNGIRYRVKNVSQFSNIIDIKYESIFGDIIINKFRPNAHKSAYQIQSLQIDAPDYRFKITDELSFEFDMNPNEEISLTLKIEDI